MGRPPDLYTHSQFEVSNNETEKDTVICRHCKLWKGLNKVLSRKKEHLMRCPQYLAWRAAGNGKDLAPQNAYNKRDRESSGIDSPEVIRHSPGNPGGHTIEASYQEQSASDTPIRPAALVAPAIPSLTNYLLHLCANSIQASTQQRFLTKAGDGSLALKPFNSWLGQQVHISRALVPFVGSIIGKIRISEAHDLQRDPFFRSIDLLVSAVNNVKKELEFIESTKRKYGLDVDFAEPIAPVRGILDLLVHASSPQASVLEGLVCLFAIEHLFCLSFQYANQITQSGPILANYSLPSYLTTNQPNSSENPYAPPEAKPQHVIALNEAFIQNWSSTNFVRFVGACQAIVDELANAQTSDNGRTEMLNCERVFKQAIWLWGQIWPDPTPLTVPFMDVRERDADNVAIDSYNSRPISKNDRRSNPISIDDDDDADDDDSVEGDEDDSPAN